MCDDWRRYLCGLLLAVCACFEVHAGGPRYVAGSTYFDPALKGEPVVWRGGAIVYFRDRGELSAIVSNAAANATVAAAAAVWNGVPTAAVSIQAGGSLAEDVNGEDVLVTSSGVTLPVDVQSTAVGKPVAVIYDADGSVIDGLFGADASDPDDCMDSGVMQIVDNLAPDGAILHAVIVINGRCTGTAAQLEQIEFQLIRAFGRVLGLAWSQANDSVLSTTAAPSYQELQGWPVMRPIDVNCNQLSTQCLPEPLQLRADDVAAVSRLYPVTAANQTRFSGKNLTAANTLSMHGSVYFRRGQGMQGVNVVVRPMIPGLQLPDDRYPVAAVSGFLYTGNRGNAVNGLVGDAANGVGGGAGAAFTDFGSDNGMLQGFYDLSGIPLPAGETSADYQVTLEAVNPLYTGSIAVGPYLLGTPTPSGTLPTIVLRGLTAGMSIEQNFTVADSAGDLEAASGGTFSRPATLPLAGGWAGRIPEAGEAAWFTFPVQAGRHFTIEAQAMDATGDASEDKLRTVLGVWNGSAADGSLPVIATVAPFNGAAAGVTSLGVDAIGSGELLLAVADQRGDGRPDYTYHGRLLYVAAVTPKQVPLSGGRIMIAGNGFHPGMTVMLGTHIVATVIEITPTQLIATVPPQGAPLEDLDLVIRDPRTNGIAAISDAFSYAAVGGSSPGIQFGSGVAAPTPSLSTPEVDKTDVTAGRSRRAVTQTALSGANGAASGTVIPWRSFDCHPGQLPPATSSGPSFRAENSSMTGKYTWQSAPGCVADASP